MKILVDAFGGDNAPVDIIMGCLRAKKEHNVNVILCGNEQQLISVAAEHDLNVSELEILTATDVISAEDEASEITRSKSNSSMAVGLKALFDGVGDAFVSAGSTAALTMGSTFIVKRIKGIKRAALATLVPSEQEIPYMMLDVGANIECRPEMLTQFALMGSAYMEKVMGVDNPKVGLLNIGTEPNKGTELHVEAYKQLIKTDLNFIGNIEAREIPHGTCNVVVADGFSGNIALKLIEGMGHSLSTLLKSMFIKNIFTKLSAVFFFKQLKAFKKKMDYSEIGGAPLMGINKPVIKAHGSSNAKAIMNAIVQAKKYAESDAINYIKLKLAEQSQKEQQI